MVLEDCLRQIDLSLGGDGRSHYHTGCGIETDQTSPIGQHQRLPVAALRQSADRRNIENKQTTIIKKQQYEASIDEFRTLG